MSWPGPCDYRDGMQHPDRVFKDPKLRAAKVETNKMGVPKGRAGGFAIVYKLNCGGSSQALRLFFSPSKEREERYRCVHEHLDSLGHARPTCLVGFGYQAEGYRHGAQWVPIQTLDWVSGETLGVWMAQTVARRDVMALRRMADQWIDLVDGLRASKIAHGDLQHGNVMVLNESPVLVDYDCMTVPRLVGRDALENGLPAYQHPKRVDEKLSLDLDNFAAWIILIAIRAVAADLTLWDRYVAATANENLLFVEADIAEPQKSQLWADLLASPDLDVRNWARPLLESIGQPFARIPTFEIDVFKEIRELCNAAEPDWDALWLMASGPNLAGKVIPPALAPRVDQARKRVECRDRLKRAIQMGRTREIASAYNSNLLDDWKAVTPLVVTARSAQEVVKALDALSVAMKAPGDGRTFVALWDRHATELAGEAEADAARQEAAKWKQKIEAAKNFLEALKSGARERAIAQAWEILEAVGGHPDAAKSRARAETAKQRTACLDALRALPTTVNEATDRKYLATYDDALLDDCVEANPFKIRHDAAIGRLAHADAFKLALAAADSGHGSEQALLDIAAKLSTPDYVVGAAARVSIAEQKLTVSAGLDRLLIAVPSSDLAIANAWDIAVTANSPPSDPAKIERCSLAVRRRDLLRRLNTIPTDPIDAADAQWLALWDDALLGNSADAATHRVRATMARERTDAWVGLNRSLAARDLEEIKRLRADSILAGHPGLDRLRSEIDELVRASLQVDQLLACLRHNDQNTFVSHLDLKLIDAYAVAFHPHLTRIEEWVRSGFLASTPLRVASPTFEIHQGGQSALIRWAWIESKVVTHCRVGVGPSQFFDTPASAAKGTLKVSIDDHRRAGGGAIVHLPADCYRLHVTVWPVVDLRLGGTPIELIGPPLSAAIVRREDGSHRGFVQDDLDASWFSRLKNWFVGRIQDM